MDAAPPDAAPFDASATPDAAADDASMSDAGLRDASTVDAVVHDAAVDAALDAAMVDASIADAAVDAGLDAASPVDAAIPPGTFEAVFSRRPADNARDTTIEDRIVALVEAARPGSRIRVALYSFTRNGPADALNRAAARGVDVRVVLDGGADGLGSEVSSLRSGLGASHVHLCDAPGTSCVGSGIMHHKTFLFSELTDGTTNVVVQASHNLTTTQLRMHNNAVIIRGDAALFAAYERTWDDLWADVENADYYRIDDGDGNTRAYFFPRGSGGDTAVSVLNNVTCDATARIRVAMAFFTNARREVAQALATRAREGCDVRVVAGDASIPIGSSVRSNLTAGGVELTPYPTRSGWGLHSKYMLIDAPYAGSSAHRHLVFTGSHNWTGPALRENDETMLRVEDDAVFASFLADWSHVHASASRP